MGVIFESTTADILLSVVFFSCLLYRYLMSPYCFWTSLGVPDCTPVPIFGNSLYSTLSLKSSPEIQKERYEHFGKNAFGGLYTFRTPSLFVKDPKLIEHILIKDFNTFYNRGIKIDPQLDPLSNHLVNLRDVQWKNLRNKLTPTFTSGKLKGMQDQLLESSDKLIEYLKKFESTGSTFELKNEMSKFTMNVIASCAFGLSINIFEDPNSEFKKMGEKVFSGTFLARMRLALRSNFPFLLKLLKWKSLPKKTEEFFMTVVKNTVDHREKNCLRRNDFLQLMMDLKRQEIQAANTHHADSMNFDDALLAANAFVFFIAGFDTTASTLSFLLYELGRNPDIQAKLYSEIKEVLEKHNGELTYDILKEMMYLDQVISETLRKYPPASGTVREARMAYTIPGTSVTLPKGTLVSIPIYALHHDPKYFPHPDKFDPERFSPGQEIMKGTYLPFGDGPRICIGLRFAKLEIKYAVIKILQNFEVAVNSKTKEPLQFNSKTLLLNVKGGLWINLNCRK